MNDIAQHDLAPATSAVFSAFIEADKALRELPAAKARLAETEEILADRESRLQAELSHSENLQHTIDELRATIAAKEAALEDATFRHDNLAKVVSAISGLLPHDQPAADRGHSSDADSELPPSTPVTPTEQPVPVPVAAQTPNPAPDQREPDPTHSNAGSPPNDSDTAYGTSPESGNPSNHPEVANSASPSNPPSEPSQASSSGPTTNPDPHTDPTSTPTLASPARPHTMPWADEPFYNKPTDMTWAEWEYGGGRPAPWARQLHTDTNSER